MSECPADRCIVDPSGHLDIATTLESATIAWACITQVATTLVLGTTGQFLGLTIGAALMAGLGYEHGSHAGIIDADAFTMHGIAQVPSQCLPLSGRSTDRTLSLADVPEAAPSYSGHTTW